MSDFDSTLDGGATATDNHHEPRPPRPATAKKPSIHLDRINGRLLAADARTHLECLRDELADALGANKRHVGDRLWLWEMFVDELESFHGIGGA